MKPVRRYGLNVLKCEFEAVGSEIREPLTVYLIGGCAMSFAGLKRSTKDVDIVLPTADGLPVIRRAFRQIGYAPIKKLRKEYKKLGAKSYYEKRGAPQFDLFVRQVCGKLWLSPGMMKRAVPAEMGQGKLTVLRVAPQDIFIFKSITDRVADREDMDRILAGGLDWDAVLDEMEWQSVHSPVPWSADFLDEMEEFDRRGRDVPILDRLRELRDRDVGEHMLIHSVIKGRDPLRNVSEHDPKDLEFAKSLLDGLVDRGILARKGASLQVGKLPWLT